MAAQLNGCGRAEQKILLSGFIEKRCQPLVSIKVLIAPVCIDSRRVNFWKDLNFQLEPKRGGIFYSVEYYAAINNDIRVEF